MSAASEPIRYGLTPLADAASMAGLNFLQAMLDGRLPAPPIARHSNFLMTEVSAGFAAFEGEPSPDFFNPLGTIHGGWISTILDSAMACCVHTLLKPGQAYTTAEFKIHFVRPIMPDSGVIRAEGRVVHAGSRLATSDGRLTDAKGRLLAHGTETCFIFDVKQVKTA